MVLGSGRSGTSLLTGTLHQNGWFVGQDLYIEPRDSNPKGFFEDREVNEINEELLASVEATDDGMEWGQRWLKALPLDIDFPPDVALRERMARLTARRPWCYKDPRFCYTLPAWEDHLHDAVRLCIFRDPARTAQSILKEWRQQEYLRSLHIDFDYAVAVWTQMYRHILERHVDTGVWLFVHYDQCLDGSALPRLSAALGAELNAGFADRRLSRTSGGDGCGAEANEIYLELCRLARDDGRRWG